jgi:hypothetical protein
MVWILLDIIDSDLFRVKGAFRILRVLIFTLRANDLRYLLELRLYPKSLKGNNNAKEQFINVILVLKNNINKLKLTDDSPKLLSELNKNIDQCRKLVENLETHQTRKVASVANNLNCKSEFAINNGCSTKSKQRDLMHGIQAVKESISKFDSDDILALNPYIKSILESVESYEFDLFKLQKATNGNEMIVLSMFLLQRHDLFLKCSIDPFKFNNFIS